MRNRDIHASAILTETAFNHSHAVARAEQARVLRELFRNLLQRVRTGRAPRDCHALGS